MTFTPANLLKNLDELADTAGKPNRYVVAFSGGLDSTVMTHALVATRDRHGCDVTAVYIDHGLQRDSVVWSEHCRSFAAEYEIDFRSVHVDIDQRSGLGLESAAREARYAAFRNLLEPGDWLLSAHHQDDQAETVLLNLMRGSGPTGLAGINAVRKFAAGWLVRPLLDVPRSALQDYAEAEALVSITDPSNLDQQFDRNYLRHEVLPRLESRWPNAAKRIRRSATLAREAATLLAELAELDRQQLGERADRLSLDKLGKLGPARQRNVLRHIIRQLGLPLPGAVHLEKIMSDLVDARDDAKPLVVWSGANARRYRNRLYLLPADETEMPTAIAIAQEVSDDRVELAGGLGVLTLQRGAKRGLSEAVMATGLELRYRVGGEEFRPLGQTHTRKLKKLLQEEGVVPWMRERLPLLYSDGRLVAVADLWLAADAAGEPGTAIQWQNRPAIH